MRPTKITQDLIDSICEQIMHGASFDSAASMNGISSSTFFRWRQEGLRPESEQIYRDFVEAVQFASEFSEAEALQLIKSAAKIDRNWKATAWFLERRFPEKYAKQQNATQTRINLDSKD